ncbi:hypothetical protein CDEST_01321 [Colletotrichum destructivum]|uniref:Uncharacterized protein n=1 Tax=Colletotrichum destructivum TaxID=34406 RepID=A0AAX4HZR3_9PEZI|nr:hypothetical protein CDEST_01321 [Colletotrichum destructivum]
MLITHIGVAQVQRLSANLLHVLIALLRPLTSTQDFINMAAHPKPDLVDFGESLYTTCCKLGCNKEVKRGEKCACGQQN